MINQSPVTLFLPGDARAQCCIATTVLSVRLSVCLRLCPFVSNVEVSWSYRSGYIKSNYTNNQRVLDTAHYLRRRDLRRAVDRPIRVVRSADTHSVTLSDTVPSPRSLSCGDNQLRIFALRSSNIANLVQGQHPQNSSGIGVGQLFYQKNCNICM